MSVKKPLAAFIGINNVEVPERHKPGELTVGLDVDITSTRALRTRLGRRRLANLAGCAHSLCRTSFGLLCVVEGELVSLSEQGALLATLQPVGHARMWHCELPGGVVAFSNGLIRGLTDGTTVRDWGVPTPDGSGVDVVAGTVPFWLTYRRLSDGLQSGAYFGPPTSITAPLRNLPVREGCEIVVYYALDGMTGFRAGSTAGDEFTFAGTAAALVEPCKTPHMTAPPAGKLLARFKSRVLIAVDNVIFATSPFSYEQVDMRRDFVQMPAPVTFIHGMDSGVWVGTTKALHWLAGATFDQLTMGRTIEQGVVLGSGAAADFELMPADGRPGLSGAFCLVGGKVAALGEGGQIVVYGANRYQSPILEAVATTRVRDGVLQYVVSPFRLRRLPVGTAVEIDEAFALQPLIVVDRVAIEVDQALALQAGVFSPALAANEADLALPLVSFAIMATGRADEASTAFALLPAQAGAVQLATESDTALALDDSLEAPVGAAAETDAALALDAVLTKPVGRSDETDTAAAPGSAVTVPVQMASELDLALARGMVLFKPAGVAAEVNAAFARTPVQIKAVGRADEADSALQLSSGGTIPYAWDADFDLALMPFQLDSGDYGSASPLQVAAAPVGPFVDVVATNTAQLEAAIYTPKRRILFTGVSDGGVFNDGNITDVILILAPGAVLKNPNFGSFDGSRTTTRFLICGQTLGDVTSGGQLHRAQFFGPGTDVSFDGHHQSGPGGNNGALVFHGSWNRVNATNIQANCGGYWYIGTVSNFTYSKVSVQTGMDTITPAESWGMRASHETQGKVVGHNFDFRSNPLRVNNSHHRKRLHPDPGLIYGWFYNGRLVDRVESRIFWCNAAAGSGTGRMAGLWLDQIEIIATTTAPAMPPPSIEIADCDYFRLRNVTFKSNTFTGPGNITVSGVPDSDVTENVTYLPLEADPPWGGAGDPTGIDWTP
jgi:hypothetical protein